MRYFFHVGYNGFSYKGWQRLPQTKGVNVQGIFEACLTKVLKVPVAIVGCGRTDAQVHAAQFFFHADIESSWDYDLLFRLNKNLPSDIAVFDIFPVSEKNHARFDAYQRTYDYFIHTRKDPFLDTVSSCYENVPLKLDVIAKLLALLETHQDYKTLCKNVPSDHSTICRVSKASFFVDESGENYRFQITSNRFLNGMIRIIVNKLVMVGRGELSLHEFESYLTTSTKPQTNRLAPPQGLYLSKVLYPYLDVPCRSSFFNNMVLARRWNPVTVSCK